MTTRKTDGEASKEIDDIALKIASKRKRPLFIMFYDESAGRITHDDVRDVYDEFRRRGRSAKDQFKQLDVLVHSYGGDADACYRVAQVIRDFAANVAFLVPFHAASGATLICLCGNDIRLGAYASLGPIDISIGEIELASIDNFREFAADCRRDIEAVLDETESSRSTDVEAVLLREMVNQESALGIGSLYRVSSLTGHYAFRLLHDYMFYGRSDGATKAQSIADGLLHTYPSHNFVLDYHMASELGLPVSEMTEDESDITKSLIDLLGHLTEEQVICKDLGEVNEGEMLKAPFFRLYPREV